MVLQGDDISVAVAVVAGTGVQSQFDRYGMACGMTHQYFCSCEDIVVHGSTVSWKSEC